MKKTRNAVTIQIIMPYFHPVSAGMETNVLETYSILAKNGWKVTVHTSKDTLAEKNVLPTDGEVRGIKIKRYKMSKLGFTPIFNWRTADFISLHNFDIFPYIYILLRSSFLKIIGKKKFSLLLIPHGGLTPDWKIYPKTRVLLREIAYRIISLLLINFTVDGIRAVSDWEKEELKKAGVKASLIRTIPNGLENTAFYNVDKLASREIKKRIKALGKYIVQMGRIDRVKNYETTIRALEKLPADIKFVIVGPSQDMQYRKELEKLIKELNLKKKVVFLGEIHGVDKFYILKHAQMMVHMATWESFCNVVHEGMSQGLVCMVANKTALPYLVKNKVNGYCIEAENHKKLAQRIQYVLDNQNSKIIKNIKERNKKITKGHTWEKVAYELRDFYESTLAQRRFA